MRKASYIKIYRSIPGWEWYKDPDTFRIFFHLLIKAERFGRYEKGVRIAPGQVLTTEHEIADELGYKWPNQRQTIRTAINHLKSTNEVTTHSTKQGTIITIENYAKYQGLEYSDNQGGNQGENQNLTKDQPTPNQSLTNLPIIREIKESKEIRESKKGAPKKADEIFEKAWKNRYKTMW